jgi:hypothetical protein
LPSLCPPSPAARPQQASRPAEEGGPVRQATNNARGYLFGQHGELNHLPAVDDPAAAFMSSSNMAAAINRAISSAAALKQGWTVTGATGGHRFMMSSTCALYPILAETDWRIARVASSPQHRRHKRAFLVCARGSVCARALVWRAPAGGRATGERGSHAGGG